jgi:hypothetical protein
MARQDAGHVPSTGTLDQNTHHGSYPSGDSFGLARRRMPSEAGNYGCPLPVQNPPTKHSNKLGTKLTWKKKIKQVTRQVGQIIETMWVAFSSTCLKSIISWL